MCLAIPFGLKKIFIDKYKEISKILDLLVNKSGLKSEYVETKQIKVALLIIYYNKKLTFCSHALEKLAVCFGVFHFI